MKRTIYILCSFILCAFAPSCTKSADTRNVVLLGDGQVRTKVLQQITRLFNTEVMKNNRYFKVTVDSWSLALLSPDMDANIYDIANTASKAEIGLVLIDARTGPTLAVRQQIIIARQASVNNLVVLIINVASSSSLTLQSFYEHLEGVHSEVTELLSQYEMGGKNTLIFLDSYAEHEQLPKWAHLGQKKLLSRIAKIKITASETHPTFKTKNIKGYIYALTEYEAPESTPFSVGDKVQLWVLGQQVSGHIKDAEVDVPATTNKRLVKPGDNAWILLSLDTAIRSYEGTRFFLVDGNSLVGMGVVTKMYR